LPTSRRYGRCVIEGAAPVALDAAPESGEPPFKGLQHFDAADADLFFGREQLTARLVKRLAHRFLAVVGTSGSGESSVVRAGRCDR
jgi:hypothetical protein